MKNKPYLSIVIPVYNESKRLNTLPTICRYLKKQKYKSELILVNDGSIDNTLSLLKKMKLPKKIKIISYIENQGKGHAVKKGMLVARGDYKMFFDIDLATPLKFVNIFLKQARKGSDVIIGSRKVRGAKLIKRQPLLRETLGKGFTFLSCLTLGVNVTDFTCGFKLFSKKATKEIFSRSLINGWGFDAEILFLAQKCSFQIEEIPVTWKDNSATRVRLSKDIINSLKELIHIRANYLKNVYRV
ncbi:glycosyltransferase [Patescibacteria group bacterium]|nr:glycosyltransferase [Patescibacteria group bacterium]